MKNKRLTSFILVIVLVVSLTAGLTACGNGYTEVKRDSLIIGTTMPIKSLNRLNAGSGSNAGYNYDVLSGTISQMAVVYKDSAGNFQPSLTDYSVNSDSKEWTFTIKKGMKWHDGQPVVADDIKFTFEQQFKIGEKEEIAEIQIVNSSTVKVFLNKSNPRFLNNLVVVRIMPKHSIEGKTVDTLTDSESVIGCGPYKFKRFDSNAGVLEFEKFNDYPNADKITVKNVIFNTFTSTDTMDMALKNGVINMIYKYAGGISSAEEKDFKNNPDFTLTSYQDATNYMNLFFNNEKMTNKNIKLAIRKAIDYNQIRSLFGSSLATVSKENFVSSANMGYVDNYNILVRDLDTAKQLLEKEGYNGSNKYLFELTVRNDASYTEIAKIIKTNLEETGAITVNIKNYEPKTFSSVIKAKSHQACLARLTAYGMTNKGGLGSMYFDGSGTLPYANVPVGNVGDRTAFGLIIDSLNNADNQANYKAAAKSYQDYMQQEVPAINLFNDAFVQVHHKNLSGFVVDGTFGIINIKTWETLRIQ